MPTSNARVGLWLFFLYTFFYGAFVLTNAFAPSIMEATPLAGVSLAVWSGLGLILLALLLALLYGFLVREGRVDKPAANPHNVGGES